MSFFEDQYDAWLANNCQGRLEDYDGTEFAEADLLQPPPAPKPTPRKKLTCKKHRPHLRPSRCLTCAIAVAENSKDGAR